MSVGPKSESQSTSATTPEPIRRFRLPVVLGLAVILVATAWALYQPPRPATMPTPTWRDADFWLYPVERNAIQRLTVVPGELHGLAVRTGTTELWVVGDGGLVAHSRDNGRHWEQSNLSTPLSAATVPSAAASASLVRRGQVPVHLASFTPQTQSQQQQQQRQQSVVPYVVGMTLDQAVKALLGAGLQVGKIDTVAANASSAGRVVSQAPGAKELTTPGNAVSLQVGRRPAQVQQQVQQNNPTVDSATPSQRPSLDSTTPTRDTGAFFPRLAAICFGDVRRGWIVGQHGVVFTTADSGHSWQSVARLPQLARGRLGRQTRLEFAGLTCNSRGTANAPTTDGEVVVLDSTGVLPRVELEGANAIPRVAAEAITATVALDDSTWLSLKGGVVREQSDPPRVSFTEFGTEGGVQLLATANGAVFAGALDAIYVLDRRATKWRRADCDNVQVPSFANDSASLRHVLSARAIYGVDDKRVMAIDALDRVWTTSDGWATCQSKSRWGSSRDTSSRPALVATEITNWFLIAGGHLYHSADFGQSWHSLTTPSRFQSLAFADSIHGWAGTGDGHVARTDDGGRTWLVSDVDVDPPGAVLHLTARTSRDVFALTPQRAYGSADGGVHWSPLGVGRGDTSLHPLAFADSAHGWGAALDTIFETTDGGKHWTRTQAPRELRSLRMSVRSVASGPTATDTTARRAAGADSSGRIPSAASSQFAGSSTGLLWWFVNDSLHLLRYEGDTTWTPIDTAVHLRAAVPVSATRGFGLDSLGSLLETTTTGASWSPVATTAGRTWPAPWFFTFLPFAVLATAVAARRPAPKALDSEKSIADILVSDRPVRTAAEDVLDFATISSGLSRFLQNPRTQPPITIAIEGQWGTGKSSLMNMVRAELDEQGFPTVWFNAWHHQREEALLAAMLESIRQKAVPPIWTLRGLRFRFRLIFARIPQYAVPLVVMIPLFAYALGYVLKDPTRTLHDLAAAFWGLAKIFGATAPAGALSENAPKTTLLVIVSVIGTVLTYLRGLKAFGVEPASIAKSAIAAGRVHAPQSQPAFRARFAKDFREVTDALKPRRLVIFVDDLDRCKPDQVLEILEAINFLVDSGDCVVILGIDRDRVTGCVAIGFKDVAGVLTSLEEIRRQRKPTLSDGESGVAPKLALVGVMDLAALPDIRAAAPSSAEKTAKDAERQLEYASRYLEKLINMEIPIPETTSRAISNVLTNSRTFIAAEASASGSAGDTEESDKRDKKPAEPLSQRIRRYKRPAQSALTLVAAALLFLVGIRGTLRFWRSDEAAVVTLGARSDVPQVPPKEGPAGETAATGNAPDSALVEAPLQRTGVGLIPGTAPSKAWWQHAAFFAASVLLLLWLVTPRVSSRVDDSDAFTQALKAWSPVLFRKFNTPRSAKKFLNQVRFLAMAQRTRAPLQRPVEELVHTFLHWSWVQRVRDALGAWRGRDVDWLPGDVPDISLVTLRVVAEQYPAWLDDPAFWDANIGEYAKSKLGGDLPEEFIEAQEMAATLRRDGKVPANFDPFSAHHGFKESWGRLKAWTRND
ncbi:MAG: P-loop NTPase fold protein [Gemmatimonadaceae bacterium]